MSNIGSDRMSYIKPYLLYPDHNPGRYYIVYFCQKSSSQKPDEFLKNINKSSRISLIDYIVPELHDDAFLTF